MQVFLKLQGIVESTILLIHVRNYMEHQIKLTHKITVI